MSQEQLAAFIANGPTGAVCVEDLDGRLLALPSQIVDYRDDVLTVDVDRADHDLAPTNDTPVCVVADSFTSYRAIHGVIAQGTVAWPPPASAPSTVVIVSRFLSFSFAHE